jgi:murein DD-endopeptidase MepM/ murein hydrolase activator NlpD
MRSILNHAFGAFFFIRKARLLLIGTGAGFAALFVAAAFGTTQNSLLYDRKFEVISEHLSLPTSGELLITASNSLRETIIQRGDSLSSVLERIGISDTDAFHYLRTDKTAAAFARQLAPGKTLRAQVTSVGELRSLVFPLNGTDSNALVVERTSEGYSSAIRPQILETRTMHKSAVIKHSLFGAADASGIPDSVAIQLVDIFGGDIDFHRDLRKGDRFSVIYEAFSHEGKQIGTNKILAAEFINDGRAYRAHWYQGNNAQGGYYTEKGLNVRKAFLRSPLEFSRITSGFSNARYHPVLLETRAHRGIDYAAPVGARVKATGDGSIEFAGVQGGYGKVIMLRHTGNRMTVYGHLSGFAPGVRKGSRVSQGAIIGYVGATGIATGPHLHYEFRVDGIHRNPLTIALPESPPLALNQLPDFIAQISDHIWRIEAIRDQEVALLD